MKSKKVSSYVNDEICPIQPLKQLEFYLGMQFPNGYSVDDRRTKLGLASIEELKDLPPATIGACGLDIFRDEDLLYAKLLHESG
jgi:acetyl esterase/lipase